MTLFYRAVKPRPSGVRLRLKDKHSKFLNDLARELNFVWNHCNELQKESPPFLRAREDVKPLSDMRGGAVARERTARRR